METKKTNYDLRKLLKPYANKWVALTNDRRFVVANGDKIEDVMAKVKERDVVLFKVFPTDSYYMPQVY